VTEVPDHLLQRSRERRAALGLGGGESPTGGATPAAESVGAVEAAPSAAAAKPAAAAPAQVEAKPPEPVPPYVEAALTRKRIPVWAMPVLAFLPLWAIFYAGSLSPADVGGPGELELGSELYASRCASCHGGGGGGGVGRVLSGGEVVLTFPDIGSMLEFVRIGSEGVGIGNPYGDPDRPGGAHISGGVGGNRMPAFADLTDEELMAVVRHERETLSGEVLDPAQIDGEGHRLWPDGSPMLLDGVLVTPDGEPLFDDEGRVVEVAGAASPGQ
jgi:mono/diheme cytochrome c family protein